MSGRAFATPEGPVAVQGAPDALIDAFRELAPGWTEAAPDGAIGTVSVAEEPAGLRLTSSAYETPDFLFEPGLGAGNGLAGCLIHTFVAASADWIALHAAAVEMDGELVVLAGDMMAGKSTLTMALSALGRRIWCDDRLPVRLTGAEFEGLALGLRPKLRWPFPPEAPPAFRTHAGDRQGPAEGGMRLIRLRPGEQAAFGERLTVGRLVILDRQDGAGTPDLTPLPLGEAVKRLVPCTFAPHLGPAGLLGRLRSLVEAASCSRMTYEDTFEAAAILAGKAWP